MGGCLTLRAQCPPLQSGLKLNPRIKHTSSCEARNNAQLGGAITVTCSKAAPRVPAGSPEHWLSQRHPKKPRVPDCPLELTYSTDSRWPAGMTSWSWPSVPLDVTAAAAVPGWTPPSCLHVQGSSTRLSRRSSAPAPGHRSEAHPPPCARSALDHSGISPGLRTTGEPAE